MNGSEFDLVDEHHYQKLLKQVRHGRYDGGVLGPRCNTYSSARTASDGGPGPLRGPTGSRRYGLPNLKPADKDKVKVGTLLAMRALGVFREFRKQGKPVVLEQPFWRRRDPSTISMFNLDEYQDLSQHTDVHLANFDQCMFGASSTKRTTVICSHVDLMGISRDCNHEKVWWTRSSDGQRYYGAHAPLKGKVPWTLLDGSPNQVVTGNNKYAYLTTASASYPAGLNHFLASKLVGSLRSSQPGISHGANTTLTLPFKHIGWNKISRRLPVQPERQASTQAGYHHRHPLRGKRPSEDDTHLGGVRRPNKARKLIPGYRGAGGVLHKRIVDYIIANRHVGLSHRISVKPSVSGPNSFSRSNRRSRIHVAV